MEKVVKREEAKKTIIDSVIPLSTEILTLETALGRVIAEDIVANEDIPTFPTSAMDGYAVKSEYVVSTPLKLEIKGEIFAGKKTEKILSKNEAFYVATGAFLPEGADAVIKVEDALIEDGFLIVKEKPKKWQFVNPEGSEVKRGEKVISKGKKIDYRILGLLARLGMYQLRVFRKPRVGVIVTGDEIYEPFEKADFGIKNANLYILKGLLEREGAEVHYVGKVKDEPAKIREAISTAFEDYDVVITTGGVSVGKADFVKKALLATGADIKFTGTNIKPGRPLTFAVFEDRLFFGLPGYPSAMLVNAIEFLIPAIRKLQGIKDFENKYIEAIAAEDFKSRKGKVYFIRVNLRYERGTIYAYSAGSQLTSNYLTSALCDALLIIPEEKEIMQKGEVANILVL